MPAEITANTVPERNDARNARSVVINAKTENGSAATTAKTTAIAMIKTTTTAMIITTATTANKKAVSCVFSKREQAYHARLQLIP